MFDSLLLMLSGMFLMMFGGWLLCLCTYRGVLFGFIYGLCSPVFKFIVMSRKSIIFLFASIVILRLFSLNVLQISFSMFSASNGVLSHMLIHRLCIDLCLSPIVLVAKACTVLLVHMFQPRRSFPLLRRSLIFSCTMLFCHCIIMIVLPV